MNVLYNNFANFTVSRCLSDASARATATADVELKTTEVGSTCNVEPAGTSCRQPEASNETEVQVHREQHRMSSDTGHYEEILESQSPAEQLTSGDDAEEAASEYAGLDPVAVAERRAQPPPVYTDLGLGRQ